jgi:hypothetical protein
MATTAPRNVPGSPPSRTIRKFLLGIGREWLTKFAG